MDTLAVIYHGLGRYGEAVPLYEETLALMKVKLGPDHPTTLLSMHNLADIYGPVGRHGAEFETPRGDAGTTESQARPRPPRYAGEHRRAFAWLLAMCPDVKVRNPGRAVELAKKAIELSPKEGHYWNTLGAADYRGGDCKAAVTALERSMELRKGGDSFDWFFLAMAHWQLGDKEEARKRYDRAVAWMEKNQPNHGELLRFRGGGRRRSGHIRETSGDRKEANARLTPDP